MKITKYGHCCLLIDTGTLRILTDPGTFSTTQNDAQNVDVILISHEHADHLHVDSVKEILKNNPKAIVVTNSAVGKILEKEGIEYQNVSDGDKTDLKGVTIEGFGTEHAEIYKELGLVENTGYFIDNALFYPGDAFYDPKRPVDILALPVAGPWMKIGEAIRYAVAVKPRVAFPVHDAVLANPGMMGMWFTKIFSEQGIEYIQLNAGETKEF
jgi:L-ascorbate metabolism protein UlaG (beta-lactamase superfamily)